MGGGTFKVVFARDSKEHLQSIADYIAPDNPIRAISYCDELISCALSLSSNPYMGKPYEVEGHEDLHAVTYGKKHKYLIIYKIFEIDKKIEIWAFWHGARRAPKF